MNVITAITTIFTEIVEWFGTALATVSSAFYNAETGLTFIGAVSLVGLAIGVTTLLFAWIRSLIKGRG